MAYSQTKKTTITEKKLQSLRLQLYGKETSIKDKRDSANFKYSTQEILNKPAGDSQIKTPDINFLKKDLLKICFLAVLALGAQILLASRI